MDDGPYRRLDDPDNREFLQYLAQGRTPPELMMAGGSGGSGNVTVGLIDKRTEDYIVPFRSFSGTGQSLRSETSGTEDKDDDDDTVFESSTLSTPPSNDNDGTAATIAAVQVRLPNGQRRAVRLPVTSTLRDLAARVVGSSSPTDALPPRFRLVAGFPPQPLRGSDTIGGAHLKGAQVSLQPAV